MELLSLPIEILREHTSSLVNHILNCLQTGRVNEKRKKGESLGEK